MTQKEISDILDKLDKPVSAIENELGMPSGTLAKAKNGTRELPEKWNAVLCDYFIANTDTPNPTPIKKVIEAEDRKREITEPEIDKELQSVIDKINKDFGAGTLMRLGDKPQTGYDVISTGSIALDIALGIGGLPRGRIVEIYGPESSGKTTLSTHVIAEAQKKGLKCAFIDAENSFDPEYAINLGVKIEELFTCQPQSGEEGLEVADRAIASGKFAVVVIDSVAALIPKAELEGEMGDSKMGLHARLMSQACRKMTASISRTNTLCIFINQLRNKIGGYGNPEVTTGGMALQFYASVRLDVRRMAQIKDGEISVGNRVKVKVVKNKCAPPFKTAEFDVEFGIGINKVGELVDIASELGIMNKAGGGWYSYGDNKIGQGRQTVIDILNGTPDLQVEIENKIKAAIKLSA